MGHKDALPHVTHTMKRLALALYLIPIAGLYLRFTGC
jgi:hypothetical protein